MSKPPNSNVSITFNWDGEDWFQYDFACMEENWLPENDPYLDLTTKQFQTVGFQSWQSRELHITDKYASLRVWYTSAYYQESGSKTKWKNKTVTQYVECFSFEPSERSISISETWVYFDPLDKKTNTFHKILRFFLQQVQCPTLVIEQTGPDQSDPLCHLNHQSHSRELTFSCSDNTCHIFMICNISFSLTSDYIWPQNGSFHNHYMFFCKLSTHPYHETCHKIYNHRKSENSSSLLQSYWSWHFEVFQSLHK